MTKLFNGVEIDVKSCDEKAAELTSFALSTTNLKNRFRAYQQARICRKIAEECIKWETLTRGF